MHPRLSTFPFLLSLSLLLLLLTGCGSVAGVGGAEPQARRDANLITREEIRATNLTNALEVVRSLRSAWLRERPPSTFGPPDVVLVYVDNVKWGEVSTLGQIAVSGVGSIRRLNPVDATQQWGPGHAGGVIWIRTTTQ
jgi:hypothetical protein